MAKKRTDGEIPHLVTRSKVECQVDHSIGWDYLIYESPEEFEEVDRATALDFIRQHGLVEVLRTRDGQVYDTPDRQFLSKFEGFFARKDEEDRARLKEGAKKAALRRAEKKLLKQQSQNVKK